MRDEISRFLKTDPQIGIFRRLAFFIEKVIQTQYKKFQRVHKGVTMKVSLLLQIQTYVFIYTFV